MTTLRQSHLTLDVCEDHGVWLDRGELEKLLRSRARLEYPKTLRRYRRVYAKGVRHNASNLFTFLMGE